MSDEIAHGVAVFKLVEAAQDDAATAGIGSEFGLAQFLCQTVERSQ